MRSFCFSYECEVSDVMGFSCSRLSVSGILLSSESVLCRVSYVAGFNEYVFEFLERKATNVNIAEMEMITVSVIIRKNKNCKYSSSALRRSCSLVSFGE